MEVKFANKKNKDAPVQKKPEAKAEPAPPAEKKPAAEAKKEGSSGEEQFKKLMPLALIGLVAIAALLVYLAKKKPATPKPGTQKASLFGKKPSFGTGKPSFQAPSKTNLLNELLKRNKAAPVPTPRVRRRFRRAAVAPPRKAAAPTKKAAEVRYCLMFGEISGSQKALAAKDIAKMARIMRGRLWPATVKLRTKPCCRAFLGPYPKEKQRKAIKHFNLLKKHYQTRSISLYNGLLEEIFPHGKGWEVCPN